MRFSPESIHLPENVFRILRDLIREATGLHYEEGRRELLADKLSPRALARGFDSFLDYYYLLKYGPGAEEEWPLLLDALSVPETYFWREMDQIRALVDVLVPRYHSDRPGEPLRIWCAACATGEEPLTIALALNEAGWFNRLSVEIMASDASRAALAKARAGLYRERSFRQIPAQLWAKYFTQEREGTWRVAPELHGRVEWREANLMVPGDVAPLVQVSAIFCRNVFIYFSPAAITQTVRRFAEGMEKPGYLFVGVSESLVRLTTEFAMEEIAGAFVYVKR